MKNIICFLVINLCFAGISKAQTFDYSDIRKNGVNVVIYPYTSSYEVGYVSINYETKTRRTKK